MIKCKQVDLSTSECGKDICCYECEQQNECQDACHEHFENCEDRLEVEELVNLETVCPDILKDITHLCSVKAKIEEQIETLRNTLQKNMEKYGVKKFENDVIAFTYVAPTTRTSIDTTKLKKELPDVYEKYQKTSNIKASVRIKVK